VGRIKASLVVFYHLKTFKYKCAVSSKVRVYLRSELQAAAGGRGAPRDSWRRRENPELLSEKDAVSAVRNIRFIRINTNKCSLIRLIQSKRIH